MLSFTRRTYIASGLASCAAWLAGCGSRTVRAAVKPESDRKKAPEFALKDVHGRVAKLSDYKGKVVLVNFWATWCGPCKIEIPWFADFEQRFKDKGFAVIGVSMDDDGWESVKPYIEEKKMNYRVVIGTEETADIYGGVSSLPTSFLVDRQGKIASTHIGLVSKSVYQNEIEHLLANNSGGSSTAGAKPAGGAK
ncbi:MAG: TlpA family protein disulfide reductase [Acidobacteria bacterium]|nr:TlpA family protein disulfide reductase [Acidobacteriota bacterium]